MAKFVLLEKWSMEVLREYENEKELEKDLLWKAPESFWVGELETKKAYTIPEALEKFCS